MSTPADASTPPPPPVHRDWAKALLGWYYSTTGTVIRLVFYVIVIGLVLGWRMGWFSTPSSATGKRLESLTVIGWKEKRWIAPLPPSTALNQFPFIEVTLAAPPGYGESITLDGLSDNLHLFQPADSHSLVSLPIETVDAPDATPDIAVKPRSFNNQVILSFLINPDCLEAMPPEIWLGYMDVGTPEKPETPKLIHLATLTAENFQGVELRKVEPAPAVPAVPAENPPSAIPTDPADAPATPPEPAMGPIRPPEPAPQP